MGSRSKHRKSTPAQGVLPFGLAEASLAEKRALLYRLVEKFDLSLAGRELLIWILNVEHDNGGPLRKTYSDLGARPRGLICSRQSTRRLVSQLDELGLLSITASRDSGGQLPNEYHLNWKGIYVKLGITGQAACETQNGRGEVQNGRPEPQFGRPEVQIESHIKEYSPCIPPNTPPSTPSKGVSAAAAVLEISKDGGSTPASAERDAWFCEAFRKGCRRAMVGVDRATADETKDDPTIRRCINYAKAFGYGGLLMLNAYAYRATDPKEMLEQADPIGPENDDAIRDAIMRTLTFVCCWGANIDSDRELAVYDIIKRCHVRCLGVTKDGHPAHPLYLKSSTPLRVWEPRHE